jgi:hypothetical protein
LVRGGWSETFAAQVLSLVWVAALFLGSATFRDWRAIGGFAPFRTLSVAGFHLHRSFDPNASRESN